MNNYGLNVYKNIAFHIHVHVHVQFAFVSNSTVITFIVYQSHRQEYRLQP